jgi:hypothetical protein
MFSFRKMLRNSWVAEQLVESQRGLTYAQLARYIFLKHYIYYRKINSNKYMSVAGIEADRHLERLQTLCLFTCSLLSPYVKVADLVH